MTKLNFYGNQNDVFSSAVGAMQGAARIYLARREAGKRRRALQESYNDQRAFKKRMLQQQGFTPFSNHSAGGGPNSMSSLTGPSGGVTSGGAGGISSVVYSGTKSANRQVTRAKRILRGVRASATRPSAMKAAMYIPGKGAEVDLIHNSYLQPIVHKIPWKHHKLRYDGVTSGLENPKGNRVSMDFALKMILECQSKGMTGGADPNFPNNLVATRWHCAHIFRHTNANRAASAIGMPSAGNTTNWHGTLGPDSSYVRLTPAQGGSMVGTIPLGMTNTLNTPYRMPSIATPMYSRLNLQALENFGWNLNPLKLTGTMAAGTPFTVGEISGYGNVSAFSNAFHADSSTVVSTSTPSQQMIPFVDPAGYGGPSASKWITQHGPGGIRYSFSNDGTNAVTMECVIVGFKQNASNTMSTDGAGDQMLDPYGTFMTMAMAAQIRRQSLKVGVRTMDGDEHDQVPVSGGGPAIFSNAETEFIPNNIWTHFGKSTAAVPPTPSLQSSANPFKFISRDQFVLGGGQTRLWKTTFPTDVYDASADSPQKNQNINAHSYMIIWGMCSAPLPCVESPATGTTQIMLSREPQNCNVSVVGTYHETPTPVFAKIDSCPINMRGSLSQVTVLPGAAVAFPAGSAPLAAGTVPTNTSKMKYVDLPTAGMQSFVDNAVDVIEMGPLSVLG